ncbi:MAG: winged helix DNA-binding domain-containing protein [Nocardioides sp.]|nr:winged helix DNA-binding domain-containing protein [Nocardioides sp.]
MSLPHVGDDERRRRIASRHALAAAHRVGSVEDGCRAVVALHATESATVHLAVAARTSGVVVTDVDTALYEDRSIVKQLAMRRTLFAFPVDLLPAAWGSAAARVEAAQARRVAKAVESAGITDDGGAWLERACEAVMARLATGPASATQVREDVPEVAGVYPMDPDKKWSRPVNVAPWVLTQLGLRGLATRGVNAGHWRSNRPVWTRTVDWLGHPPRPLDERAGYAELVRRWLAAFGPGTTDDIQWWLGATKGAVRLALDDLAAEEVSLDGGSTGWVLPGDHGESPEPGPWAALLPTLDPTTMGWKQRDFYLDPAHRPFLFDTNGNAGTTAWWNGRIVGCWVQDDDAVVRLSLLEDVGSPARRALEAEAERLTAWLDGVVISHIYASAQMRHARLP